MYKKFRNSEDWQRKDTWCCSGYEWIFYLLIGNYWKRKTKTRTERTLNLINDFWHCFLCKHQPRHRVGWIALHTNVRHGSVHETCSTVSQQEDFSNRLGIEAIDFKWKKRVVFFGKAGCLFMQTKAQTTRYDVFEIIIT